LSSSELDFSTRIQELDEGFTGRLWLINQVNDFLYKSEQKYLVISGEPGIGKSAIAAHLVRQGKTHGHHFCRAQEGTTLDPIIFVRSLTHQLVRRLPDFSQHVIEPEAPQINVHLSVGQAIGSQIYPVFIDQFVIEARDAGEVFRRLIAEPLKRWANPRLNPKPVVLLVDGLDEAMKLERHPSIFDLIEQARDLPRAVRWVLTSRPGEHLSSLRGVRLVLSAASDEQQGDIRSYTSAFLDEPIISRALAVQKLDRAAYLDLVTRRSEGNFLYLKLAFAQLRKTVAADKPLARPAELPPGLEDLYREYLYRLTRSQHRDSWKDFFRPGVRILAVARDALDFAELALLSGASPQSLNDLLSELAELLDSGPEGNGPYRLHHASFADFMTDRARSRKFWIDEVECHCLISDVYLNSYGTNWERCSDYGLRFLVHHLSGAGRQKEISRLLIREPAWTKAKVSRLGERSFQDDIEAAVDSFNDPVSDEDAIVLIQLWMLGAVARVLSNAYSDSILEALMALGREEEAVSQARSRIDPLERFQGLKLLLSLKFTDGGPSIRLINETLTAVEAIQDDQQQAAALNETVRILNPANRWDEILKSVRELESVSLRAKTLKALVSWLRESNDPRAAEIWVEALEATRGIAFPDARAIVLRQLVPLASDEESFKGILAEACVSAQSIPSANERAICFLRLSQEINERYQPEAAKVLGFATDAAREMRESLEKARVLHQVSVAQIELGDKLAPLTLSEAAQASTNIISVPRRAELQEKIACSMGAVGSFDQAVGLARNIPYDKYAEIIRAGASLVSFPGVISDDDHQATALYQLSLLLIAAGKHKEAIATALHIGNIFNRALSLQQVALDLVEQGDLEAARQAACSIDEQAFCQEGERKADDCDYIDAAFEPMDWGRSEALHAILKALLEEGQIRRALDILDDYDETRPWSEAMTTIAEALLGVGENKAAIRAIRNVGEAVLGEEFWREWCDYDFDSYPLFLRAAEEAACDDPLAVSSAKKIEDTTHRAEALAAIGRSMINRSGKYPHYSRDGDQLLENALEAVCSLREGASKVRAARNVCMAMVQADRVETATRLMTALKGEDQAQVCEVIVKELLEAGRNDEALRFASESGGDPILQEVITVLIQSGRFDDALKAISGIKDRRIASGVLRSLADALRAEGKSGRALRVAQEIDEPIVRARAILDLARERLEAGINGFKDLYEKSLVAVTEMRADDECYRSLESITERLLEVRRADLALGLNCRIPAPELRLRALSKLSKLLSIAGENSTTETIDRAMEAAHAIEEAEERYRSLRDFAAQLWEVKVETALRVWREAMGATAEIENGRELASALKQLARVPGLTRDPRWPDLLEKALTAARGLGDPSARSEALAQLGETLARIGDQRAGNVLTEALDATQVPRNANTFSTVLRQLIQRLTESGRFREALRISELIRDEATRARAGEEIGMGLVRKKRFAEAMELTATVPTVHAKIREAVFDARLRAREFDEALRIAEATDEERERTAAVVRVARALIHAKRFKKALEIAQSISSDQKRIDLLALLASVRMATNRREAMRIVRSVLREVDTRLSLEDRALALVTILDPLEKLNFETASQVAARARREAEYSRDRVSTLSRLARWFEKSGDDRASETFDQAWEAAQALRGQAEVESLMVVASNMDDAKHWQASEVYSEALSAAASVYKGKKLVRFIQRVLAVQEDEDVLQQASEASESLHGENELEALMVIGRCMLDASSRGAVDVFDRALRLAAEIYEGEELIEAVKKILDLGDVAELYTYAIDAAESIVDEYDRVELLSTVAQGLAEIGMEESVEDVVRAVDDETERRYVQAEVDAAYVRLRADSRNFTQDTWNIVEDIEFDEPREAALEYMGSKLADRVGCDRALEIMRGAISQTFLDSAIPGVINALLKADRVEEAIELARNGLKSTVSGALVSERFTAAVNNVAQHLAAKGKLRQAISLTTRQDVDASIGMLIDWFPTLDRLAPDLGNRVVTEAVRVAGWARADWRDVHEILRPNNDGRACQSRNRRTPDLSSPESS